MPSSAVTMFATSSSNCLVGSNKNDICCVHLIHVYTRTKFHLYAHLHRHIHPALVPLCSNRYHQLMHYEVNYAKCIHPAALRLTVGLCGSCADQCKNIDCKELHMTCSTVGDFCKAGQTLC